MDLPQELKAIDEIRQLKSRYFRFVDTKDWQQLAMVFCRDAIFDTRQASGLASTADDENYVARGRDAIVAYISQSLQGSSSVHHGHGHEVHIDSADEAHGIVAMEDLVKWEAPRRASLHGYGHYHELYRVEDGAWRLWRSTLTRLRVETDLDMGGTG